jgi:hypothetical protein
MENTKFIWSDKQMTRKIVGEGTQAIHTIFNSHKGRSEVQNYHFLCYIDPVGRDGGRNITARITVYEVIPETEIQEQNPPGYFRESYWYPPMIHGEVLPDCKRITYGLNNILELKNPDFEKVHEALKVFEIAVAKFLEVFKDYIPEP